MDSFDFENIYEYVKKIIDERPEYDLFYNGDMLREESALYLTRYLGTKQSFIVGSSKQALKQLINRWIDNDLIALRSQTLQNRSKTNAIKTKRKKNLINTKVASIVLVTTILGGAAFGIATSLGRPNSPEEPYSSEMTYDNSDKLDPVIKAKQENRAKAEAEFEKKLVEIDANTPDTTYGSPRGLNEYALEYMPLLSINYQMNYNSNNSMYAQIPLYDICHQISVDYGYDSYRTMDIVLEELQTKLKGTTYGKDSDEYKSIANFKSYPEYVYEMLRQNGYDVNMYTIVVEKYNTNKNGKTFYAPNHGLNQDEEKLLDDMFSLYDEYMSNLKAEYGRAGRK